MSAEGAPIACRDRLSSCWRTTGCSNLSSTCSQAAASRAGSGRAGPFLLAPAWPAIAPAVSMLIRGMCLRHPARPPWLDAPSSAVDARSSLPYQRSAIDMPFRPCFKRGGSLRFVFTAQDAARASWASFPRISWCGWRQRCRHKTSIA